MLLNYIWNNTYLFSAVADAIRTSLGPRGMDKMVINNFVPYTVLFFTKIEPKHLIFMFLKIVVALYVPVLNLVPQSAKG